MIGLGLDLCQVRRIERAIREHPGFLERYYTEEERAYLARRGQAGAESAAAMFAAKEAFLKALGLGLSGGVSLREIGVSHGENGAPRYVLTGAAAEKLERLGARRVHLSLTHEDGVAGAVAIVE